MDGSLQLWELPPSVAQFFYLGWGDGRAERQPEITRLERENNWLHYQLTPAHQRNTIIEQRLTDHLTEASDDDWGHLEQLLRQIANHSEDATPLATEEQHDRNQQAA